MIPGYFNTLDFKTILMHKLLGALSSVLLEEGQLKIQLKSKGKQLFQQEVSLKYLHIFEQNCFVT